MSFRLTEFSFVASNDSEKMSREANIVCDALAVQTGECNHARPFHFNTHDTSKGWIGLENHGRPRLGVMNT